MQSSHTSWTTKASGAGILPIIRFKGLLVDEASPVGFGECQLVVGRAVGNRHAGCVAVSASEGGSTKGERTVAVPVFC